ncbi:tRNA uridine-5-carboxymethylaminomethyl(34) synthesis enzyme MnmG [uncultured Fenollaria sp.]|uniref:tRNA uridine-5-carboxymethylaminomethyl(34) synthesis enzyme MnmG n=1 Tax=uncultured Fenollaria sp. TaxID=1686315 RepID=UPI0025F58289|nr:tRNA uridine-5-carboxymethylaminomethyl(34) synthesis enzyme MnmG [uncultured Fenollaria sp.]
MQRREKTYIRGTFDAVVVGAGHAGCEAALALARLGKKTSVITISLDAIAAMSCNPNIGGTGKGHLVREIDALGGEMAKNIDKTYIQSRMLNTSKGPAVHSLRVQADKQAYHREMKKTLEQEPNLTIIQGEVDEVIFDDNGRATGVRMTTGAVLEAKAVILATGTYLKGRIFEGELNYESGPDGRFPARYLSASLNENGIDLRRMKTGTPARVHRRSIDTSKMAVQEGDKTIVPFSFMNEADAIRKDQEVCYLTYTTKPMHEYILAHMDRSARTLGDITGEGPRYCPSIEDKVLRFKDKDQHQVFIEPEGTDTDEMYIQGVSTALPEEMQVEMYRMIEGLEHSEIMRSAYAIEYDAIDPTSLKLSLESKKHENLFFAGQINGSSGYEEAAAQGIMAGINCYLKLEGKDPFIIKRSEGYIGVLIDDLVTKGTNEPYRMMTSRCEYRLSLRQDNADMRLTDYAYRIGLASEERYNRMLEKKNRIEGELEKMRAKSIGPKEETNAYLESLGTTALKTAVTLEELLRRPEIHYSDLAKFMDLSMDKPDEILELETIVKYDGYIKKQNKEIENFLKMEERSLRDFDYSLVKGLKTEAKEKLEKFRPSNLGQASRISGVTPADINNIIIYMEVNKRK